ncbi:MAG: site-specific tyrosine recombinase/integron integrase [Succinivibrionaceae bacterium]|nr:site-specific tyrosine recombinase/integron integrase [Succinivibrionaceae bacterium]
MLDSFKNAILQKVTNLFNNEQLEILFSAIDEISNQFSIIPSNDNNKHTQITNDEYLEKFETSKKIEGCSEKTLNYYKSICSSVLTSISKPISQITTEDLRTYITQYQQGKSLSKVTVDNVRRILSSLFSWLEEENYILKSPMRRIHKVKTTSIIKETFSDEDIEKMRDNCENLRDLALIDFLSSTGMRIGELVLLNKTDLNFNERECIVLGKGDKERVVYFDAKAKIHIQNYINSRTDANEALFVTLKAPYNRISIGGIESRLRNYGKNIGISRLHPHKFRRSLATIAIDKGMPIEQLQKLLGHKRIDTTLQYAMVKQNNIKLAHKKYIG